MEFNGKQTNIKYFVLGIIFSCIVMLIYVFYPQEFLMKEKIEIVWKEPNLKIILLVNKIHSEKEGMRVFSDCEYKVSFRDL